MDSVVEASDVIFAALPHGLSEELAVKCAQKGKVLIDLGADFRLESSDVYSEWYGKDFSDEPWELHKKSVYGLCEYNRDKIKSCDVIANPGCLSDKRRTRSHAGCHKRSCRCREIYN